MTDSEIKRLEELGNKIFRKKYKLTSKDLYDKVEEQSTTKEL